MNIAIVDDSPSDRIQFIGYIKKYAKENTIQIHLSEYSGGESFFEKAQLSSLDVIFLDIIMNGLSGMDVAHRIKALNPSCRIVFVTASDAFAVQSYKVKAFYYILKPYTYEDIDNVMNMLGKNIQKSSRYIKVKEGRDWCKIFLSDILYIDYNNHYVQIHTSNSIISTYMKFS